jgi:hypothetical protein
LSAIGAAVAIEIIGSSWRREVVGNARVHADRDPTLPPRSRVVDPVTLVGNKRTGTVSFALRGPLTHHIVWRGSRIIAPSRADMVESQLVPVGKMVAMFVWAICRAWFISGSMSGRIVAMRVARLMDSLKLSTCWVVVVAISPLVVMLSRVTFRIVVVELRPVTLQPNVPVMLKVGESMAIIGQTIPALKVELRIGWQDWANERETDKL